MLRFVAYRRQLTGLSIAILLAAWALPSDAGPRRATRQAPAAAVAVTANPAKPTYPVTRRAEQVDTYHGVEISDPYRWLEDPDSPETRQWIAAQNQVTFGYLQQLPQRSWLKQRLAQLWNYERYSIPHRQGGRYFYQRNDGLQNQPILYFSEQLESAPRVLLDPNRLSADGTVALSGWRVSRDGRYLAYGLASAGSDWREWRVREVASGRDQPDVLKWVKFSDVSWTTDHAGFYYSRYDEPKAGQKFTGANYYQKLYYHRLGEPQANDQLIYERPDEKEWAFDGQVTEDGNYLVIRVWRGTDRKNQVFVKDLRRPESKVVELIQGFDAQYNLVGNEGSTLWFQSDCEAPRGRILAVSLEQPEREHWRTVVAETTDVLLGANVVGDRFLVRYLRDASSAVRVFQLDGKAERDVDLPGLGTAEGFDGWRTDGETFYSFSSYTTPVAIYRYDVASGKSTLFRAPRVAFQSNDYAMKKVFFTSKDGTRVPMTLAYRRGVKTNGENPTLLHGYGGFNVSLTPAFSVANIIWLEMGGVLAVPNLRGGGEYGREWHEAGMKDQKQNVFDDFLSAAQWLIDEKYTNRDKLAITGRSNGGLLVGAALTQRPDLFAAALPGVGVMDMLRYHKFTIGWAWTSEYGSAENPDEFSVLRAYSPLHNLKPKTRYPATLVTTADHDDRVVPAHSFKFAAALQAAQASDAPVLIRIETRAGHGAGTPTSKLIEASADSLAFLATALKMNAP